MIGKHLGERYELTHLVSEGPIFSTYAARDRVLGKDVGVRVLRSPFSGEQEFIRAAKEICAKAGSVVHPGVEKLLGVEQSDTSTFLISEASPGSSLSERIRKLAPYSVPVSVSMAISVLEGLSAIHQAGYAHGDVGSYNVSILPNGTARLQLPGMWEAYPASETAGSVSLATMAPFLAPEVSAGARPSPASDVYSTGVILFHLLTGRAPYVADTPVGVAMKHATSPTPSARSLNPSIPTALDQAVAKAMAKEPDSRYQDAGEMLRDLKSIEESVRFGKAVAPIFAPGIKPSAAAGEPAKSPQPARAFRERDDEPSDVPGWLKTLFVFLAAVAVSMVGLWFVFNMSAPQLVKVPEIKGMSLTQAKKVLEGMQLNVRVTARLANEKYPADTVLEVNPDPGKQVREGGYVTVKLSSGSKFVVVPDLRGRTLDESRSLLGTLDLVLDDRVQEAFDKELDRGRIVKQNQAAGTKVERASAIRVTVSSGRERPKPRESEGRFIYTLKIKLAKIDDEVLLRVDMTDANDTRTIYESTHLPDDEVTVKAEGVGTQASFRIFYDGQLVNQVNKVAGESDSAGSPSQDDRSSQPEEGE